MDSLFVDKVKIKGTVERTLYSGSLFYSQLHEAGYLKDPSEFTTIKKMYLLALERGMPKQFVDAALDKSVKPMFADNFIWRFIKKVFNLDLRINFLTGFWTINPIRDNLITTKGHQQIAQQLGGTTTTPMTAMAIGTGTNAASISDTQLQTEITTLGGARAAGTITNVTVTATLDSEQWVHTWNFTGTFAVTEEGILDNNASGGNMLAHQVFSVVNVVSGDSLQITHKVTC
jgi:hypothetical protein